MKNDKTVKMAVLSLCLFLLGGCAEKKNYDIIRYGEALKGTKEEFFLSYTVEASIIGNGNSFDTYYDYDMNGEALWVTSKNEGFVADIAVRFPYTMEYDGAFYTFGFVGAWKGDEYSDADGIYLYKSLNKKNWQLVNNGKPLLTRSRDSKSIWYQFFNVSASVDSKGMLHMVIDCQPKCEGNDECGLAYLTCAFNDDINLNNVRTENLIIEHAGCCYSYYNEESNEIFVVMGKLSQDYRAFSKNWWWTTSAIYNIDTKQVTDTSDSFSFGFDGVHVCDPHLADYVVSGKNKTSIVYSYDQDSVCIFEMDGSIKELFYKIKENAKNVQ